MERTINGVTYNTEVDKKLIETDVFDINKNDTDDICRSTESIRVTTVTTNNVEEEYYYIDRFCWDSCDTYIIPMDYYVAIDWMLENISPRLLAEALMDK